MYRDDVFERLFHKNFRNFGCPWPHVQVVYVLASQHFPIGYIGDKNTPAGLGREVVDRTLSTKFGLIFHLSLRHDVHSKTVAMDCVENIADPLDGEPSITINADAIIVPRSRQPFAISTFLGDCAMIAACSDTHIGYMHLGRPEIFDGLIHSFMEAWRGVSEDEPSFWVGPMISGKHYEYQDKIHPKFEEFAMQTAWDTQGINLWAAMMEQFGEEGIHLLDIQDAGVDPFELNERGDHTWAASARWYKRKGDEMGVYLPAPRNAPFLFFNP